MSALSGHQASGNTTETSPEDTTRKLDHVLQHFDVIASRRDTFIFRFLPVSLIGLFFLFVLTIISIDILISFHPQSTVPPGYTPQFQIEVFLFYIGFNATPLIGILLTLWTFNIWRSSVPKTLRDIFEKKLIAVPGDDVTKHYLRFLENYRRALGSPKRYLLNALPACSVALLYLADVMTTTISYVSSTHPIIIVAIFLIIAGLLGTFGILGGLYGLGTLVWVVCISGGYIRSEEHTSELQSPAMISYAVFCLKSQALASIHVQNSATSPRQVWRLQGARQFLFWLRNSSTYHLWLHYRKYRYHSSQQKL